MPQYRVMLATFPYGGTLTHQVSDWLTATMMELRDDPRVSDFTACVVDDTPITMTRNRVLLHAEQWRADFVVMADSDMVPDQFPQESASKPFWKSSFDYALEHYDAGPCFIAAPYCGPPPHESVYVFKWADDQSDNPNPNFRLQMLARSEAARLRGIQAAAALPTGLILMDMRGVRRMPHERFYYEWKGDGPECPHCGCRKPGPRAEKASTEDVSFSRDAAAYGVKLLCNWDAWAGHVKRKVVSRPQVMEVSRVFRHAAEALGGEKVRAQPTNRLTNVEAGDGLAGPSWTVPVEG